MAEKGESIEDIKTTLTTSAVSYAGFALTYYIGMNCKAKAQTCAFANEKQTFY